MGATDRAKLSRHDVADGSLITACITACLEILSSKISDPPLQQKMIVAAPLLTGGIVWALTRVARYWLYRSRLRDLEHLEHQASDERLSPGIRHILQELLARALQARYQYLLVPLDESLLFFDNRQNPEDTALPPTSGMHQSGKWDPPAAIRPKAQAAVTAPLPEKGGDPPQKNIKKPVKQKKEGEPKPPRVSLSEAEELQLLEIAANCNNNVKRIKRDHPKFSRLTDAGLKRLIESARSRQLGKPQS